MNRQQKLILLCIGLLDLGIVLLFGSFILNDLSTPPPKPIEISSCTLAVSKSLSQTQPIISWTDTRLDIAINLIQASEPITAEARIALASEQEQALWTILDAIAVANNVRCQVPDSVTLIVNVMHDGTTMGHHTSTTRHIAQLSGSDVTAWAQGELSDESLATRSIYRQMQR